MSDWFLRKLKKVIDEGYHEGIAVYTKSTLKIPWEGKSALYFGFAIRRERRRVVIYKNGIEFFVKYDGTLKDADTTVYTLITGIIETACLLFMTNNKEVGSAMKILMENMTELERVQLKNLMKDKGWDI